eukprot:5097477-Pleurochrysis_carterae.AAC.1
MVFLGSSAVSSFVTPRQSLRGVDTLLFCSTPFFAQMIHTRGESPHRPLLPAFCLRRRGPPCA